MNEEAANPVNLKVRARRIRFELAKIFSPDDARSVPLLRLMMAADDVRHLQKLLLSADARVKGANNLERSILNGEILHLYKLLCGHLYEAGNAFRNLDQVGSDSLDTAVGNDTDRKEDLDYLRHVYATTPAGSFHYDILKRVRDYIGFHYKEHELKAALQRHAEAGDLEGNLIVVEHPGLGRYSITDHFGFSAIQHLLRATPENLHEKFSQAMLEGIKIAGALFRIVDHFLLDSFQKHEHAIIVQEDGEVIVSPEVAAKYSPIQK